MKTKLLVLVMAIVAACAGDRATYSSAAGTFTVSGAMLAKYRELGAERGTLGYPVAEVRRGADGSAQMLFEHGFILVRPSGEVDAQAFPDVTFDRDGLTIENPDASPDRFSDLGFQIGVTGPAMPRDFEVFCVCTVEDSTAPGSYCGRPEVVSTPPRRSIRVRCPETGRLCNRQPCKAYVNPV